jgi:molybdopterin-guanine dinucleotide biosynthesis protein B
VAKHAQDLELDKPGKDSWRLARAGADAVWVSSPEGLFMHRTDRKGIKPEELPYLIGPGFDILFVEGFKESQLPKIEVHRKEIGGELLFSPQQLLAVVTDEPLNIDTPVFSWDNTEELADFIEDGFLSQPEAEADVSLFVNKLPMELNPFMVSILNRTLTAMVSTLRGAGEVKSITVHIDKNVDGNKLA